MTASPFDEEIIGDDHGISRPKRPEFVIKLFSFAAKAWQSA
jgi:hypothetical protein